MDDKPDYEALWQITMAENEALRKKLGARFSLPHMTNKDIIHWIEQHYLFCIFALFLVSSIISACYVLYRDGRQRP